MDEFDDTIDDEQGDDSWVSTSSVAKLIDKYVSSSFTDQSCLAEGRKLREYCLLSGLKDRDARTCWLRPAGETFRPSTHHRLTTKLMSTLRMSY